MKNLCLAEQSIFHNTNIRFIEKCAGLPPSPPSPILPDLHHTQGIHSKGITANNPSKWQLVELLCRGRAKVKNWYIKEMGWELGTSWCEGHGTVGSFR